jgi:S-DNA-T family DNA segregation ATPase FtsK/SpoIIIE
MAKEKNSPSDKKKQYKSICQLQKKLTKQHKIVLGALLVVFYRATSCVYFFYIHGQEDQSAVVA